MVSAGLGLLALLALSACAWGQQMNAGRCYALNIFSYSLYLFQYICHLFKLCAQAMKCHLFCPRNGTKMYRTLYCTCTKLREKALSLTCLSRLYCEYNTFKIIRMNTLYEIILSSISTRSNRLFILRGCLRTTIRPFHSRNLGKIRKIIVHRTSRHIFCVVFVFGIS